VRSPQFTSNTNYENDVLAHSAINGGFQKEFVTSCRCDLQFWHYIFAPLINGATRKTDIIKYSKTIRSYFLIDWLLLWSRLWQSALMNWILQDSLLEYNGVERSTHAPNKFEECFRVDSFSKVMRQEHHNNKGPWGNQREIGSFIKGKLYISEFEIIDLYIHTWKPEMLCFQNHILVLSTGNWSSNTMI
jgi:hypothetical protein